MSTRFHRARIDCVVQYPAPRDSEGSREANYTILFSFQNVEPGPRRSILSRQEPLSGDPFFACTTPAHPLLESRSNDKCCRRGEGDISKLLCGRRHKGNSK